MDIYVDALLLVPVEGVDRADRAVAGLSRLVELGVGTAAVKNMRPKLSKRQAGTYARARPGLPMGWSPVSPVNLHWNAFMYTVRDAIRDGTGHHRNVTLTLFSSIVRLAIF